MKIVFIGTSHGFPEADRRCSCTMLEVSGRYYFIDMGTMASEELIRRGISYNDIKAVFITHCHGDHTNGLTAFYDLCNWYYKEADPLIFMPKQEAITALENWEKANTQQLRGIRTAVTNEGLVFDDGYIKVTAIPTLHIEKSFAYIIEVQGKVILFSGDLKHPTIDFPKIEKQIDLAVCEAAHFSPLDYINVFEKLNIKNITLNHIYSKHNKDIEELIKHKYPISPSYDGLEIEI